VYALDGAGDEFASSQTDSAGQYTLSGLSPSASYRVEFSPPYGSSLATEFYPSGNTVQAATPVTVTMGQTTPNINETLVQGASISGVVTDAATGYPLGGTDIRLFDAAGRQVYTGGGAITEPDGSYNVTNLAPGSYKVEFVGGGNLAFQYYNDANTLSAASPVNVSAGQTVTNVDAALSQGGILKGVVTDAASGQPLANASVTILDAKNDYIAFGITDSNGDYEVSALAPGTYYVEFFSNYQTAAGTEQSEFYGGTSGLAEARPVTITAGQTTSGIDIALSPPSGGSPGVSRQSTGTPATTPPPPPVAVMTRAVPGPPTLSGGSLTGLGKGKPVVRFRLRSGTNGGHKLRSFKVKLPAGLALVAAKLRSGVKVTGGGKVTERLTGGQLVVTLGTPAKSLTVSISALRVTAQLEAKAAQKRSGTLRVLLTVTPVNAAGHRLSFTVRNPS
jgi:hypothetical protein